MPAQSGPDLFRNIQEDRTVTYREFFTGCMMEEPKIQKERYIFFVPGEQWAESFIACGFRAVSIDSHLTVDDIDRELDGLFLKPGSYLSEHVFVPVLSSAENDSIAAIARSYNGIRCEMDLWKAFYHKNYLANGDHQKELEEVLLDFIQTHEGQGAYEVDDLELRTINMFARKKPEWICPGIQKGGITLLCAEGGVGKSFFTTGLLADLSAGRPTLLDNVPQDPDVYIDRRPLNCMFFSSEDSIEMTAGKRFDDAGADERRILSLSASDPRFEKLKFRSVFLEKLIEKYRPDIVVFDPLQGFIDEKTKMSERNGMRTQLSPLLSMGEKYGTAFVIICHANKRDKASGRSRVSDSSDIWDAARSVFLLGFADEEKELRYISHEKSNNSKPIRTVLFGIQDGRTVFRGTTLKKDADFVAESSKGGGGSSKLQAAREHVLDIMTTRGRTVAELRTDQAFLQSLPYNCNLLAFLPDNDILMSSKELEEAAVSAGDVDVTHRKAKQLLKEENKIYFKVVGNGSGGSEKRFFVLLRQESGEPSL